MLRKMKNTTTALGCLLMILALIFPLFAVAAEPDVKFGLWETTIKTEMAGMPMQQPALTHTQCITKENMVPDNSPPNSECKMVEKKITGNTATWRMECQGDQGTTEAKGQITYVEDAFDGTIEISTQGMTITQKLTGKRLGDCDQ